MSIAKRNIIETINRLIPAGDDGLREQLIDLHLGRLSDEDIKRIREGREREAEMILEMFPKIDYSQDPITSHTITNGEPEKGNDRDNRDKDALPLN